MPVYMFTRPIDAYLLTENEADIHVANLLVHFAWTIFRNVPCTNLSFSLLGLMGLAFGRKKQIIW
jgi:hypothetical protein